MGPTTGPSPVTTDTTSAGTPARTIRSTIQQAVSDVWTSGLMSAALPAINAGIASLAARVKG